MYPRKVRDTGSYAKLSAWHSSRSVFVVPLNACYRFAKGVDHSLLPRLDKCHNGFCFSFSLRGITMD